MTTWPIRIGVAWTVFGGTWADRKRMPDPFKTIDESVELVVTSQRKFSHLGPATAVREPDHDLASKCARVRYPIPLTAKRSRPHMSTLLPYFTPAACGDTSQITC